MTGDTITAIATPLGEGGLAVIRISGPAALQVGDRVFVPSGRRGLLPSAAPTHTVHHGEIRRAGRRVDEVMLAVFRAPRSFTREDTLEISCHGGLLTTQRVLETVLEAGARLATPGEFTKRAFLNGRIDLTQAEAVADLIHARTDLAAAAANEQLAGMLSREVGTVRDDLMRVMAHVEAHIDFPDEDIAPDTREELLSKLDRAQSGLDRLLSRAREGQILRNGIRVAIVGRPNAGKSSLLNRLLGHERAIVSPIAGTTRDTIEATANIRGIPVIFVDTAGLRDSSDPVEREGIRRSHQSMDQADVVLEVLDASEDPASPAPAVSSDPPVPDHERRILVLNKTDRPRTLSASSIAERAGRSPVVEISCETGAGLELLKDTLRDRVWSGAVSMDSVPAMINARHQEALRRARESTRMACEALDRGESLELVAMDLRIAVQAVGEVVGKTTTEDLLDAIFSQFCLGK